MYYGKEISIGNVLVFCGRLIIGLKKFGEKKLEKKSMTKRKWSLKYKKSINCNNPKGFSQKQHCKTKRIKK